MVDAIVIGLITGLVIVISVLLQFFFSIFEIIFKKPLPPKGAIEIDPVEHIYAHPDYAEKLQDPSTFDVQTIFDVIKRGVRVGQDNPQFSYRKSSEEKFQSYSYNQVFTILKEIGSGIVSVGLKPSNETYIGIYGSTIVEYALFLFSTWPYSMVPIGIYDSLGRDGVRFIIRHAELRLIFADDLQRVKNLLEWQDETSVLKVVVSLLEPTDELIKLAEEKNLTLITLEKLRENGRNNPIDFVAPKPKDTAMIMYTSGSTGEPKGRRKKTKII